MVRFPDGSWREAPAWDDPMVDNIPPPKRAVPTPLPQGIVWGVFLALASFACLAVVPPRGIPRHRPAWFGGAAAALLGVFLLYLLVISPFIAEDYGWDVFASEGEAAQNRPYALGFLVMGSAFLVYGAVLLSRLPERCLGKAIAWSCLGGLAAGVIATALYRPGWSPWIPAVAALVVAGVVGVVARRRMAASAAIAIADDTAIAPG